MNHSKKKRSAYSRNLMVAIELEEIIELKFVAAGIC